MRCGWGDSVRSDGDFGFLVHPVLILMILLQSVRDFNEFALRVHEELKLLLR